jgi:hypothetical protein
VWGIPKAGDEQFVFICQENSGKFPMSNTKVAIKNFHNREFIQIDTKHH